MKKILIVVDAPGPAEFIAPVIPLLKKSAAIQIVAAHKSASAILKKYRPVECFKESDAANIYRKTSPDLIVVAMSSLVLGPFVNDEFIKLAKQDHKKTISFQDAWANHRWPVNAKFVNNFSSILTIDELAENLLLQDGYKGRVVVTGSPSFDELRKINVGRQRSTLRKKFGVKEKELVILHTGTGTPQSWKEDEITFKLLAAAVRILKKNHPGLKFFSHPHPRDTEPGRYRRLAPDLNIEQASKIRDAKDLLPIADVIVGMYATNLIHACYLKIPAISVLLPNAGKKRLAKVSLPDFPPNVVGATIGIYKNSPKELAEIIEEIYSDPKSRKVIAAIQKRFFSFDKKSAAEKVTEAIRRELR